MIRFAEAGVARRSALLGLLGLAATAAWSANAPAVLSQAALVTPKALGAAMLAVTRAGRRLVAVGERGTVLLSDDHGTSWKQAQVPVQATLTSVYFADAKTGWAAGHMGVILRSDDAGATWRKQLDGIRVAALVLQAAQAGGDGRAIANARRLVEEGADKPFFDLAFTDVRRGFAVGAYGLMVATLDGGNSWQAVTLPNPKSLHLYGLRADGGGTWLMAGEQGLLLRSTDGGASFSAIDSPYKGSFFGLLSSGNAWVAYGLRGTAYRSTDAGMQWEKLDTGVPMAIGAGVPLPDGGFVLLDQAGDALLGHAGQAALQRVPAPASVPASGLALAADGGLVLASLRGMRRLPALPVN